MNPFKINCVSDILQTHTNNLNLIDYKIQIWLENIGRKKNNYISGWNILESNVKKHLKYIKKKIGCNGTIKKTDGLDKNIILLQGDHIKYMYDYMLNLGIESDHIHIKG